MARVVESIEGDADGIEVGADREVLPVSNRRRILARHRRIEDDMVLEAVGREH